MGQFLSTVQKMRKATFITFVLLVTASFSYGFIPKWYSEIQRIRMLETTREEAEKLLGYPKIIYLSDESEHQDVKYKLNIGVLRVSYSQGKCSSKSVYGYNVEKGIITRLSLEVQKTVDIKKLNLDLKKFKPSKIPDIPSNVEYRREDLGTHYNILENSKNQAKILSYLSFFPSTSQDAMRCAKNV